MDTHGMSARGIFAVLAGLLVFGAPAWADPPARVGRVSWLEGAVAFASDGSEKWETASLNYPVTSGDRISTAEEGRAEVHVGSTAIRLAPDSGASFTVIDDNTVQVRLDRGSLSVRLRRVDPDGQFEVDTQTMSISLKDPVALRVDQAANGDATVWARIGSVEVATGQATFTVYAGQTAGIPAADPSAYWVNSNSSVDAWDQWVAERDAAEDSVASARYVSREMDGVEDLDDNGSWEILPSYGPCWVPNVPTGIWRPYAFGRWAWVAPWGWTWIDAEPWGFAPFHYGRWAQVSGIWVWVPGAIVRHPVFAPALVRWDGDRPGPGHPPDGARINWTPLRPREPYRPEYQAYPAHVHSAGEAAVPPPTPGVQLPPRTYRRPAAPQGGPAPQGGMTGPQPQRGPQPVRPPTAAPIQPRIQRAPERPLAPDSSDEWLWRHRNMGGSGTFGRRDR